MAMLHVAVDISQTVALSAGLRRTNSGQQEVSLRSLIAPAGSNLHFAVPAGVFTV